MKPSPIPAVEVEPPGCSYNPTDESHQVFSRSLRYHLSMWLILLAYMSYMFTIFTLLPIQEALAHAVADEMQKVYRNELGPEPVPLTVPGEAIDEEEVSVFCASTHCSLEMLYT